MAKVSYPQFESASEYVIDPYWKDILGNCARGKFPRGVRYDAASHTFSIKTQKRGKVAGGIEVIELRNKPDELANDTLCLFREKLDLFSAIDLKIREDEFALMCKPYGDSGQSSSARQTGPQSGAQSGTTEDAQEAQEIKWKSIRPKHMKDLHITNFVISLKKKYNLSDEVASELGTNIAFAIQLKSIHPEHIHIEDGVISHIDGVEYDETLRKVVITATQTGKPKTTSAKTKRAELLAKKSAIATGATKYAKSNNNRLKAITEFL